VEWALEESGAQALQAGAEWARAALLALAEWVAQEARLAQVRAGRAALEAVLAPVPVAPAAATLRERAARAAAAV
jgi:hypothetical protein